MIVEIEIKDLTIPQGLLPRVLTGTVEEKVREYTEMLEQGVEFDPILVWKRNDGSFWVVDGVHRTEAHKRAGKTTIKAKLIELKDELEYRIEAIKANLKHGLPLQKEEKVILAQTLYKLGVKIPELRKIFGVSERTIYYWLESVKEQEKIELKQKAMELLNQGLSTREVADKLGVDQSTVVKWGKSDEKLQKLQNFITPPETQSQKPQEEEEEEIDWEMIQREWEKAKAEGYFDDEKEEKKKGKVGRPRKEEDTRSLEEQYEDAIYTLILKAGLDIGWVKAFEVAERALNRAKEYSKRAVRGW